jgi:hypothetical protein
MIHSPSLLKVADVATEVQELLFLLLSSSSKMKGWFRCLEAGTGRVRRCLCKLRFYLLNILELPWRSHLASSSLYASLADTIKLVSLSPFGELSETTVQVQGREKMNCKFVAAR